MQEQASIAAENRYQTLLMKNDKGFAAPLDFSQLHTGRCLGSTACKAAVCRTRAMDQRPLAPDTISAAPRKKGSSR